MHHPRLVSTDLQEGPGCPTYGPPSLLGNKSLAEGTYICIKGLHVSAKHLLPRGLSLFAQYFTSVFLLAL